MREIALESVVETLAVVLEVVAVIVLSTLGANAELAGIERLAAGVDPMVAWYVYVGTLALYVSVYELGYRRLLPRFRPA